MTPAQYQRLVDKAAGAAKQPGRAADLATFKAAVSLIDRLIREGHPSVQHLKPSVGADALRQHLDDLKQQAWGQS